VDVTQQSCTFYKVGACIVKHWDKALKVEAPPRNWGMM
jgi:hypothetical protein